MEKDRIEELLIEVKTSCATISSRMDSVLLTLANHENRLMTIEKEKAHCTENQDSWKNQLMLLLAKGVVSAVIVIGTLCGAGGALKMIFK